MRFSARILVFAAMVGVWNVVSRTGKPAVLSLLIAAVPLVLAAIVSTTGRRRLDLASTPAEASRVTLAVHYLVLALLGLSTFEALQVFSRYPLLLVPCPRPVAVGLAWVTGVLMAVSVLNLALKGWGAPFAVALSSRLATDWLYRYTRNPMGLATMLFLASVGLVFQSLAFLLWLAAALIPAWIHFVRVYEERELEFRFGEPYLAYRRSTSFLLPGRSRP